MSKPLIFVCYALDRNNLVELRHRFDLIREGIEAAGYQSYFHVHDGQNWDLADTQLREVLADVFAVISSADAVLLDLTAAPGSRRTGLNIEAGYAKALDKPIAALWHHPDRPAMTTELAKVEAPYEQSSEIPKVVALLMDRLSLR